MVKHIFIGSGRFRFDLGLITVEPVMFLYMFTTFLYFPVLQSLIFDKVCYGKFEEEFCHELKSNSTFKDAHEPEYHDVNSETSHMILKTTISMTIPSFVVVVLFLGALGDRVDRKIPVILSCFGALFAYVSGILNAYYMSASINYLLIGQILNGLCGGFIACLMAVYSYVGHISSSKSKMKRVGVVEAMIFLAGTLGMILSGVMLETKGYIFTFAVMIGAIVLAIVYSFVWVDSIVPHESLSNRSSQRGSCYIVGEFLRGSLQCVSKSRPGHVILAIALQVITLNVLCLCTSGDIDISLLYLRESLNMSTTLYGFYKGLDNFLRGLILITIIPLLKRFTNVKNLPLVCFGLLSFAANMAVLGIATKDWMAFLAATVGMFKGVPSAGLRATMSSMVSSEEQGRLFGLIAASESLTGVVASLLFNELYPATYSFYHGLCYLLAAGLIVIVIFVILFVTLRLVNESHESQPYEAFVNDTERDPDTVPNNNFGDIGHQEAEA